MKFGRKQDTPPGFEKPTVLSFITCVESISTGSWARQFGQPGGWVLSVFTERQVFLPSRYSLDLRVPNNPSSDIQLISLNYH